VILPVFNRLTCEWAAALLLVTSALACSKSDSRTTALAAAPPSQEQSPGAPGGKDGAGAAAGSSRVPPTVVLGPSDVKIVQRGSIESGTPITGNLKPIEEVSVRARLDGDLTGVFVREGEHVTAGQLLAKFEDLEQESARVSAEADRASAQSDVSTAQWNADQSQELFKAGAIPERDLRAAQQALVAARARLAASEAKLRSIGMSARDTRVIAPAEGIIGDRLVENGEHVARGAPMFTLVRNSILELAAAVPERSAGDIRPAQVVRFRASNQNFEGRVARISPIVNPNTRSVTVYVQIPNTRGLLKGNTFAAGRIVGSTIASALLVPTSAVRQLPDNGKPFVWRVVSGQLDQALVDVGIVDEEQGIAEIRQGLSEGDQIVVGNVGTLGKGMHVQTIGGETNRKQVP
jgi:membrane fusion protein (multidrug efflux system)